MIKSKILKLDYSTNIQNVIYAMAIVKSNIQVVGSQSKNILYPNDYDCYEVIKIKSKVKIIDKFKSNIKKLLKMKDVYIGDIKIGVDDSDTPLRWKVAEILKGSTIVNNKTYELKNVFNYDTMNKLDVIFYVNEKYTDFSTVYQIYSTENTIEHVKNSLSYNIMDLYQNKIYFKCLKRMYSYFKIINDKYYVKKLTTFFNTDNGIMSNVCSSIETLLFVVENEKIINKQRIDYEIDNFKNKMSNILNKSFLKKQKSIVNVINKILNGEYKIEDIIKIYNTINSIQEKSSHKFLIKIGFTIKNIKNI